MEENMSNDQSVVFSKLSTTFILATTIIIVIVTMCIRSWSNTKNFFKRINVPGPDPVPVLGNFGDMAKKGLAEFDLDMINRYGKICGVFEGSVPVILTTDIKFMKTFMIKDFNSFVNRRVFDAFAIGPTEKFLTVIKDDDWKNVRSIVSTTFTSGKLKLMSKCIKEVIKNYEKHLEEIIKNDGVLKTKTFYTSYTLDVISSCCFGMDTNSINDQESEFLKSLRKIFSFTFSSSPVLILAVLAPKFAHFLARNNLVEFFPSQPTKFLEDATNVVIERRKKKLDRRDDFIQIMLEHEEEATDKKEKSVDGAESVNWNKHLKKKLTNSEILAQALLFFIAGYETTATTLEFVTYMLAMHPEVQDRLLLEVDDILEKHNGEITYETVGDLKYMDMVIDETMRVYPPAFRLDRVASNDYDYNGIKIKKDTIITVSIYALHHDPEIYPNPEQFDPERFNDENKRKRDNDAFMPFGAGPRICIGMRFALIEVKLMLTHLLSKYRFEKCEETPEKITLENINLCRPKETIAVKVVRR